MRCLEMGFRLCVTAKQLKNHDGLEIEKLAQAKLLDNVRISRVLGALFLEKRYRSQMCDNRCNWTKEIVFEKFTQKAPVLKVKDAMTLRLK